MKKVKILCFVIAALVIVTFAANDPVISLSYLNNTIKPEITAQIDTKIAAKLPSDAAIEADSRDAAAKISVDGAKDTAADMVLEVLQESGKYLYSTTGQKSIKLHAGDVLTGLAGTKILMRSGSASLLAKPINLTRGAEVSAGSAAAQNTLYMLPADNGSGIKITSNSANILVDGVYRIKNTRYRAKYFDIADALLDMNLFRGSSIGYELERGATRTEAIVMLIRLLGEEEAARNFSGSHPFDDVPAWASTYLAYAYEKGYARGVTQTHFGGSDMVSAAQYTTFLLRALGYSDTRGDFTWDKSLDFGVKAALITAGERSALSKTAFMRDQMAYLSYYSLFAKTKGSDETLLKRLTAHGAVSAANAAEAIAAVTRVRPQ
ncbi:MAG: hypothetical protein RSC43_03260 [Clostridia bacterium]